MIDFEIAPPPAEIGLLVKHLQNGDTDEVSVANFLVLVKQLGRDVRLNPLAEDLECFVDGK